VLQEVSSPAKAGDDIVSDAIISRRLLIRRSCGGNQHWIRAIGCGEQTFQILDLRQIVVDDVRMARMPREEILMIVLGRVELPIRLDLRDDRSIEEARLVELRNIGLGNPGLLRIRRKDCRAILRANIRTLAIELGRIMGDQK